MSDMFGDSFTNWFVTRSNKCEKFCEMSATS